MKSFLILKSFIIGFLSIIIFSLAGYVSSIIGFIILLIIFQYVVRSGEYYNSSFSYSGDNLGFFRVLSSYFGIISGGLFYRFLGLEKHYISSFGLSNLELDSESIWKIGIIIFFVEIISAIIVFKKEKTLFDIILFYISSLVFLILQGFTIIEIVFVINPNSWNLLIPALSGTLIGQTISYEINNKRKNRTIRGDH